MRWSALSLSLLPFLFLFSFLPFCSSLPSSSFSPSPSCYSFTPFSPSSSPYSSPFSSASPSSFFSLDEWEESNELNTFSFPSQSEEEQWEEILSSKTTKARQEEDDDELLMAEEGQEEEGAKGEEDFSLPSGLPLTSLPNITINATSPPSSNFSLLSACSASDLSFLCSPSSLEVNGVSFLSLRSDFAQIKFSITITRQLKSNITLGRTLNEEEAALALRAVSKRMKERSRKVIGWMEREKERRGIRKLRTISISIQPIHVWRENNRLLRGYTASLSFSFRSPIGRMGGIIDELMRRGVTEVDNISFLVGKEKMRKGREIVIKKAVEDGMKQARIMLRTMKRVERSGELMGRRMKPEVKSISISSLTSPYGEEGEMGGRAYYSRGMAYEPSTSVSSSPETKAEVSKLMASTPILGETKTISAIISMKLHF